MSLTLKRNRILVRQLAQRKNVRELVFVMITCKAVDFVQVTLCWLRSYASCKLGNKYSVS